PRLKQSGQTAPVANKDVLGANKLADDFHILCTPVFALKIKAAKRSFPKVFAGLIVSRTDVMFEAVAMLGTGE
ncbi:MAG: hypothetical protein M3Q64_01910, partial [bacterium]|nr:hypothetical protein [bacterium]